MDPLSLVARALAQGLRLAVDGDQVRVRGPRHLERLVRELQGHRAAVLELLGERPELVDLDPFTARAIQDFEGDLVEGGPAPVPLVTDRSRRACFCCGGRSYWRLRSGSDGRPGRWVCIECHPPLQPEVLIEHSEEVARG